jgi:hypothetical protein
MANPSLKKIIEAYCLAKGVTIPPGFARHPASRYVVIRRDSPTPKLVAKTWFKQEDVAYYAQNTLLVELGTDLDGKVDFLDFKEGRRLQYSEGGRFQEIGLLDS